MKHQKGLIAQKASAHEKPLIPSSPKRSEYPLTPSLSNGSVSLGSRNSARHFQSDLALLGHQVSQKRTQYFVDTENEMQEQRRRDFQVFEMEALSKHLAFSKNQRVKALCCIFIKKLKRNNIKSTRFYNYLAENIFTQPEANVEPVQQAPLSLLLHLGYTMGLLLVFVYHSLCFSFSTVLMACSFSITNTFVILFSAIKLCHTIINYRSIGNSGCTKIFKIKGFNTEIVRPCCLLILGIVLMLLYLNNKIYLIQYVLFLSLFLLFFQIKKVLPQLLVQITSYLRTYNMLSRSDLITLGIRNLLCIQILAVILSRMIVERPQLNWASRVQSFNNCWQIYLRSLLESFNIIFTASFGFPSPESILQTYVFLPLRIATFLISFLNLQAILLNLEAVIKRMVPMLKNQRPETQIYRNIDLQRIIQRYRSDRIKYIQAHELLQYFHGQHQHPSSDRKVTSISHSSQITIPIQEIFTKSITVLAGLSHNLCQQLADKCHLQIVATGTILTSFNSTSDWLILAKGKVSAVPMPSWGLCEANSVDSKLSQGPVLLSCHLLSRKTPKWRLKCNTTSLIYRIVDADFRRAIRLNYFDHQLIWSQHDKHSFQDEFSLFRCCHCNQAHSDFECPHIHYAPLVSTVVLKHRRPILLFLKRFKGHESRLLRIRSSALKFFGPFQQLVPEIKQKLWENCNSKLVFQLLGSQRLQQKANYMESTVIEKAAQRILGRFKINPDDHQDQIWQLKTDELWNYKYYFPRHNPSKLVSHALNLHLP